MEKGKVTIYDVADSAGVAISTVSRVLNNSPEVSADTRQRVLDAIEKLQFRPDRTAKTLAQKKTNSIAVAVPSFTSLLYNEMLKGVKDCLREYDIDLLLCNMGSGSPYQTLWRFLDRGAVDALIVTSLPMDDRLSRELNMLRAPVALVGTDSEAFDSFYYDDSAGAKMAVDHLTASGRKSIGMIIAHAWSFNTEGFTSGYRSALEGAGIAFDPDLVKTGDTLKHAGFSAEAGFEAMKKLLETHPNIEAVFTCSDVQALGAWMALREAGKRVPEDVALIGYDDVKVSKFVGLSTIDGKMQETGYAATELVLKRLSGLEGPPQRTLVTPELKVRMSSDINLVV